MPSLDRLLDPIVQWMAPLASPEGLLAWAATYLLCSTLLLGAAWGASRLLRGRHLRLEERLWKAALVGALLIATIQTGVAAVPAPAAPGAVQTRAVEVPVGVAPATAPALRAPSERPVRETVAGTAAARSAFGAVTPEPRLATLSALLPGWQKLALGTWAFGALLLTGLLAFRWTHLRRALRRREDVAAGTPRRLLDRLLHQTASRRRVRLTGSDALPVPVALGVGEQEICLPRRALRELDDRRQEGLLAHELAHLERRDPAWLLFALGLQSVLFFQPLNRIARRRLEEIAEIECDAWAVRATGDRVGLAQCLTEVAGWLLEGRGELEAPIPPGAAAMARRRGQLGERVRRILAGAARDDEDRRAAMSRRWLSAAAATGLLALALVVPGFAPSSLAAPNPVNPVDPVDPADPQVASGAEGVEARAEGSESEERQAELRAHQEADEDWEHDPDSDGETDRDWDWDWDFEYDHEVDSEEIERLVEHSLEMAEAGLLDDEEIAALEAGIGDALARVMESMPEMMEAHREALAELERSMPEILAAAELEMRDEEGRNLTDAEREEIRREIEHDLAEARDELRHAMEEMGPEMEEMRRAQREVGEELRREMREAHEEIERERRELERNRQEIDRDRRVEVEEVRREIEEVQRAAEVERREAMREAERDLAEAHREIEEARRELERERRELDQERRRLEEERRRLEEREPPAA